jgi:phosphoglycolate phosphatase-like HAD superfamily hydrolase
MSRFVLFDLDNTLVDSLHLKPLRDKRTWPAVYAKIPTIKLFDGIADVWTELRTKGVHLGIVTHSPRPYATKVLQHVGLVPDALIAYHDLNGKKKPSSFGYQQCAAGRDAARGVAVGDEEPDLLAADTFGCRAAFAGWARNSMLTKDDCLLRGWIFLRTPAELIAVVDALR